jgi:hypothetical protein
VRYQREEDDPLFKDLHRESLFSERALRGHCVRSRVTAPSEGLRLNDDNPGVAEGFVDNRHYALFVRPRAGSTCDIGFFTS